ncbi:toprim domain-containing protein [Maribacter sp. R86514]|uniref:toprim domain-containing protein n=1 Tax=Maribacter sp. R86514 TaxID=3093854 RepID=UPI0037C5293B
MSKKLNRWYDHGEGKGGNVIDLICLITKGTVKEALKLIEQDLTSLSFQQRSILKENDDDKIIVTKIKPLTHVGLKEYLKFRGISISTANKLIKEVHYDFKDGNYFAIGLQNKSRGWELRNKYYKNSSSPKDITCIRNGNEKLVVVEGMFDLMSLMEIDKKLSAKYDFLVLNSTAFVEKAVKFIITYRSVVLYLDNDANGKRTAQKLMRHANNCEDKSVLYEGFKDINGWLIYSAKKGFGQGARDVFLLPQKQTRFTPGGRKEEKK